MNCAARTTLSPSVGPKYLYLAACDSFFLCESGPNNFTENTRIPNLDVQI
jgi:hypothetical protein